MSFQIQAKLEGLPELLKSLDGLKPALKNRILRNALKKGSAIILKAARAKVPVDTGILKKSLGVKDKTYPSGVVVVLVGPRSEFTKNKKGAQKRAWKRTGAQEVGKAAGRKPMFYGHLVEFGSRAHKTGAGSKLARKGSGKQDQQSGASHPGSKAQPFLRPALDENKQKIIAEMARVIKAELAKEAARLNKRQQARGGR